DTASCRRTIPSDVRESLPGRHDGGCGRTSRLGPAQRGWGSTACGVPNAFWPCRSTPLGLRRGGAGRRRSNVIGPGAGCKGPAADRGGWYNQTVDGGGEGRRGDGDGSHCREGGRMSDDKDQVYGPERAQRLVTMLRALAERIQMLDRTGQLLDRVPELQKLLGNTRSELFHYEVRVTTTRRRSRKAAGSSRTPSGAPATSRKTTRTTSHGERSADE